MLKLSDVDTNVVFIRDKDLTRALAEALKVEHGSMLLEAGIIQNELQHVVCNTCKLLSIYDQIKEDL
ncbi:hypothetical protein LCGC14_1978780 [marine sediment metagenome]|uniref:Uncharacterized protein n=1 Tax=marine sediment metagenome TaxID=412755 RepID=A0A0F9I6I5_9ZZZZ